MEHTFKINIRAYIIGKNTTVKFCRMLRIYFFASIVFILSMVNAWAEDVLEVGFSSNMFIEVNQNDALASVKAWTQMLAKERNISGYADPKILKDIPEIRDAIQNTSLDCLSITTEEYYQLRDLLTEKTIILGTSSNSIFENYLLLVHENSKIENLKDLEGKKLIIHTSSRNTLAPLWLDTLLMKKGMKSAEQFFSRTDTATKLGKVIIPVFFKQADACLVTRKGFDITVELNPQIGKNLKAIAVSPDIVPSFFIFTGNDNTDFRKKIREEFKNWHLSPAGKQSLTIFQADMIIEEPIECLESALELITLHKKLFEKNTRKENLKQPVAVVNGDKESE